LDKNRPNPVEWAGHADIVEGPDGGLYSVFLAIRPNENKRVNTGRETFMLPVDWSGEFPVFQGGLDILKPSIPMPKGVENKMNTGDYFPNGNFTFTDNFGGNTFDHRWVALRGPRESFSELTRKGVKIKPLEVSIREKKPISALFYRQQHNSFAAEVEMDYTPASDKDFAGITCLQSENFHYVFGITKSGNDNHLVLARTEKGETKILASKKLEKNAAIRLQVTAEGDNYKFNFSQQGTAYENLGGTVSGDILSTNIAGGFTGALIGLYATKNNEILL